MTKQRNCDIPLHTIVASSSKLSLIMCGFQKLTAKHNIKNGGKFYYNVIATRRRI